MANRLQIKKNVTNDSAPSSLEGGELAYTVDTNTVYVGSFGDLSGISVLSDGDTVVKLNDSDQEMLILEDTDGTNTVTLQVPPVLTSDVTLKFPETITENYMLVGTPTGQLQFKTVTTASLTSVADLDDGTTPDNKDVLKWDADAGEWKHISNDDFRTLLGFGSGDSTYHNMIVDGTLIVGGATEFGTSNTIIKDKTLALGVAGGVLEYEVDNLTNDILTITTTTPTNRVFTAGDLYWIDGQSIDSGIYSVNETVTNGSVGFNYTGNYNDSVSSLVLVSAETVNDTLLDGAGFRVIGTTNKTFQWNKGDSSNPFFQLDGGNLIIKNGDRLYMDGLEVFDTNANTLDDSISLEAEQLDESVELDGGEY